MQRVMGKGSKLFDEIIYTLMPLSLIGNGFIKIVGFYIDRNNNATLTKVSTWSVLFVFACLIAVKFILVWKNNKLARKRIKYYFILPILYTIITFIIPILMQTNHIFIIKNYLTNMFCFALLFLTTICISVEKMEGIFLAKFRWYALAIAPAVIYYIVRFFLPFADYDAINFGIMDYMSFSYLLLYFCVFLLFDTIVNNNCNAFIRYKKISVSYNFTNSVLITLFSAAITMSGTKGTILCLLTLVVATFIYTIIVKNVNPGIQYTLATSFCVVITFLFILTPANSGAIRVRSFFVEIANHETVQKPMLDEFKEANKVLERVVGEEKKGINEIVSSLNELDIDQLEMSDNEKELLKKQLKVLNQTYSGARSYLWKLALQDIKSAPIIGHGPLSYNIRHVDYTHNILLEIGADFGIPALVLFVFVGILCFVMLYSKVTTNKYVACILIWAVVQLPRVMISGSAYDAITIYLYGTCLAIYVTFLKRQIVSKNS